MKDIINYQWQKSYKKAQSLEIMKCNVNLNFPMNTECSSNLNHVNQDLLSVGDDVAFEDPDGNRLTGKIVEIKHKKDGTIRYKIKAND